MIQSLRNKNVSSQVSRCEAHGRICLPGGQKDSDQHALRSGSTTQSHHARGPQYPVCLTVNGQHLLPKESEGHKYVHMRLVSAEKSTCTATDVGEPT